MLGADVVLKSQPISNKYLLDLVLLAQGIVSDTRQPHPQVMVHRLLIVKHLEHLCPGELALIVSLSLHIVAVVLQPLLPLVLDDRLRKNVLLLVERQSL